MRTICQFCIILLASSEASRIIQNYISFKSNNWTLCTTCQNKIVPKVPVVLKMERIFRWKRKLVSYILSPIYKLLRKTLKGSRWRETCSGSFLALQKEKFVPGRSYVSQNYLWVRANMFKYNLCGLNWKKSYQWWKRNCSCHS